MANVIKHRFASGKLDGADATQVQPSHWNDGHAFTGGNAGDLLTRDPTDATYGAKWQAPPTPPIAQGYQPYGVVWGGSGGAPAIGNGSLVANYWRQSQTIFFAIRLTIGTTTNLGAGAWNFTIPFPAESASSIGMGCYGAAVRVSGGSQPFPVMGALLVAGGSSSFWIWNLLYTGSNNVVTSAAPFAWAASDYLHLTGTYYAAAGSSLGKPGDRDDVGIGGGPIIVG